MNFNRALVRLQKGIYCKISKHLFEAKRAYIDFKGHENNLHTLTNKGAKLILKDEKNDYEEIRYYLPYLPSRLIF